MLTIILTVLLLLIGAAAFFGLRAMPVDPRHPERQPKALANLVLGVCVFLAIALFIWGSVTVVHASHIGVLTTFGRISQETLPAGLHFVGPIARMHEVYTGVHVSTIPNTEAGSKDLQSVHATMTVNFHPNTAKIRELYAINTSLNYDVLIVPAATQEVFKAVVSQYTSEEVITKRQEVSQQIHRALSAKLEPYFLVVQSIQLVNFSFSKSFDAAIEEKVTAGPKVDTARRNLERAKIDADARIVQARGEAEAIRIQAEAVAKAGGDEYVRLKAVEKWSGVLPLYVTGGVPLPFINASK